MSGLVISSKLQKAIDSANDRLYKKLSFRLSSDDISWLSCFEHIIDKTNVSFAFFEHKIKINFSLNNKEYIIDYFIKDKNFLLIGKLENNEYTLEQIQFNSIEDYLAKI